MDLRDKVIIMTGATSGLGVPAAKYALQNGAKLWILYRDVDSLKKLEGIGNLQTIQADLSSKKSIVNACNFIKKTESKIDILINNAGLWIFSDRTETNEGIEMTFMVNLLAPYILIKELTPLLNKSSEPRVINTASALHQGNIQFSDVQLTQGFSGFNAYRQSKLGIILLSRQLAIIHPDWKVVSQHPGVINTNLGRGNLIGNMFFRIFGKSPEKGAETLISLMKIPFSQLKSGAYYADSKEKNTSTSESKNIKSAERLVRVLDSYL